MKQSWKFKRDHQGSFYFSSVNETNVKSFGSNEHYHSHFEIYYLTQGQCRYFINDKVYIAQSGDIVLIPGGTIHKSQYPDKKFSRFLINCSNQFIPTSVFKFLPSLMPLYHNAQIEPEIHNIFLSIEKNYKNPDIFSEDTIRYLMYELFILIARNPNQKTQTVAGNVYSNTAIEYINNNFRSKVSLDTIAEICCVTPEYMSKVFKKETGFTFSEYLTYTRLKNAETLLKSSNLSITEIAYKCGFTDSNYFSVVFKKIYGVSPRQIKNKS